MEFESGSWDRERALRTEETLKDAGITPTNAVLHRLKIELEEIEQTNTEGLSELSQSMEKLIKLLQSA